MSFLDMVDGDIKKTFLNLNEFAEVRSIIYDGETYVNIPVVLIGPKERTRQARTYLSEKGDHSEGLYLVDTTLYVSFSDLRGVLPEEGQRIQISESPGGTLFFRMYYILESLLEMGMIRLRLEAVDE